METPLPFLGPSPRIDGPCSKRAVGGAYRQALRASQTASETIRSAAVAFGEKGSKFFRFSIRFSIRDLSFFDIYRLTICRLLFADNRHQAYWENEK
jgi:hypothetical protein